MTERGVPPPAGAPRRRRGLVLRRSALLLAAVALGACRVLPAERAVGRGVPVTPARAKPDFVLTATDGTPYDFAARTRGQLTLLFFGYTHCPDVCPVHLANIAAALDRLPPLDRRRVTVVFVTTDPARDTPERMRSWLDAFDPGFVGLHGRADVVAGIQHGLGIAAAVVEPTDASGRYAIGHAAQVLAFTPDDSLRAVYPSGVRQEAWVADFPRLLEAR